jgi:hypothetical protein
VASKYFLIFGRRRGRPAAKTTQHIPGFSPSETSRDATQQLDNVTARKLIEESRRNTCFTMRSYFFRRQDGQAPIPAGMTICTPASVFQQRQVSPAPDVKFVPLGAERKEASQQKEK